MVANRYYIASVDVADASCFSTAKSRFRFYVTNDPVGAMTSTTPRTYLGGNVVACNGSTPPEQVVTTTSNGAFKAPGGVISLGLENNPSSGASNGTGNDSAIDNFKLLEATPRMDKAFTPSWIRPGGVSRMTFTITNTSDLVAKDDWNFTDILPAGVVIAPTPNASSTCTNTAGTLPFVWNPTPGLTVVTATGGDLQTGTVSCTISADVTVATAGTRTNVGSDVTTNLVPPPDATIETSPVSIAMVKKAGALVDADNNGIDPGDTITYTFTVTNTGTKPLTSLSISDAKVPGATCPAGPLAPGASADCTGVYAIIAADITAGVVNNTATATGLDPNGAPVTSGPSSTTTPIVLKSGIALDKSASPATGVKAGDTVTYTFVATNTGNVALSNVNITEGTFNGSGTLSPLSCAQGTSVTIIPGATYTCQATYVVQQGDINRGSFTNNASTTGTPPVGAAVTATDNAVVTAVAPAGAIDLTKTPNTPTGVKAGDTVTYTLNAKNTGNVTLTNVSITEGTFTGSGSLSPLACAQPATLQPGQTLSCTATYVATQADVDRGSFQNTASTVGTPPTGPAVTDTDTTMVTTVTKAPALTLDKVADKTSGLKVGDVVTYSFTAKNTGNTTLNAVSIAETAFSGRGTAPSVTCTQPVTLAPGATLVCSATYTVVQGDVDAGNIANTAQATGTPTGTTTPINAVDDATVTTVTAAPAIDLQKAANKTTGLAAGDSITYTFTAKNIGNVTLSGVSIAEGLFSGTGTLSALACDTKTTLAPGESRVCTATYTLTQADVDAHTVTNNASATGNPPTGPAVSDGDDETVTAVAATPAITLTKVADKTSGLKVGDLVTYTFTAQNTGNVTLTGAQITEGTFTGSGMLSGLNCAQPVTLAPTASLTCTATYTVTQADVDRGSIVNNASTTANPPTGPPVTGSAQATVTTLAAAPAIVLDKAATPATGVKVGDTVAYTFTATNVGNVTLSAVTIAETEFTGAGTAPTVTCAQPVTLAPGQSLDCTATYVAVQADVDAGEIYNKARAQGTPPGGAAPVNATDDVSVATVVPAPAIDLVKLADKTTDLKVGDKVTYTFTATNIGNATLTGVTIAEGTFSGGGTLSPLDCTQSVTLIPGAALECTATYTVVQADVDADSVTNTATTSGTAPGGARVTDDADETFTTVTAAPELTLTKVADKTADLKVGDEVTYTLTAANTGNVTLTDVSIAEGDFSGTGTLSGLDCTQPVTLTPGQTLDCTVTYTVEQGDVDAGSITNAASATGTPPTGDPLTPTTETTVTTEPSAPAMILEKVADKTSALKVGDKVTYTFTAANTGNVTLTDVSIAEGAFSGAGTLSGLDCTQPATLAPGETLECTATYTVVQADVDAGSITNAATSTGTPPTGDPLTPTDETTVTTEPGAPAMTLTKVADKTSGLKVGDEVTYTFTAANTGNVTLTDVSIAEGAFSGAGTLSGLDCTQPATLAPGETLECTATYTVVQADVDAGSITNAATSTGTPPTGDPLTPTDETTVTTDPATPNLTLDKVADKTSGLKVGGIVTYTFTAKNTGNVTLTDVSIAEGDFSGAGTLSGLDCTQPVTLAPGETLTCLATYAVVQADVDAGSITNAATATGTPPTGDPVTPTDETTVTTDPGTPGIALAKVASPATGVRVGDTVTYTLTATNTGNVTLTGVTISETDFTGAGTAPTLTCDQPATVAPGQTLTCTASYVVEQDDVNAGEIYNAASVSGTPPTGPAVTAIDDASVTPVQPVPAIALAKVADKTADLKVGDEVTYTLTATNTGNVTLTDVSITEGAFSGAGTLSGLVCTQPTTLDPGQTLECTATYTVVQADVDAGSFTNEASVVGTPPTGPAVGADADETVTTEPEAPAMEFTKVADKTADLKVGDEVTYTLTATNTGNVTLTDVSITEGAFSGAGTLSGLDCTQPVTLAPGATLECTATYTVVQADVDAGSITNAATATGTPPTEPPLTPTDETTVTTDPAAPNMTLVKVADKTADLKVGDEVTYTLTATNTGNVTLTDVSITEGAFSGAGTLSGLDCTQPVTLAPGATLECTATYTVVQADVDAGSITNAASATGTPPTGDPLTPTAEETVTTEPEAPAMTFTKVADKTTGLKVGDEVTYTFTATNTGNVTLTDVSIAEGSFTGGGTLSALDCTQPATLAPGQTLECTATYTVVQADVDAGSVTNAATATGTPPTEPPLTPSDETTVTTDPGAPAMTLEKVADKTSGLKVGDVVTYTFTATNTGNVTLTDASIAEGAFSGAGTLSGLDCTQPVTLAPGTTLECTASYTVVQADVDAGSITNAATATGTPPTGDPVTPTDETTVTTDPAAPAVSLVKTASPSSAVKVGDTVTYGFTATNTGNVTLTDVSIAETDFTGAGTAPVIECAQPVILAPRATLECSATYVAVQADINAGEIYNAAIATGTPPTGADVTGTDDVSVTPVQPVPAIALTKVADKTADLKVGDEVIYTLTATNTGNVTLTDVSITEGAFSGAGTLSGLVCTQPTTLDPGQTLECTATYTVVQADVDAGSITNQASVVGTPPTGEPVGADADETVTTDPAAPNMTLEKVADKTADLKVGDEVTYTLTATNTGNVTLTDVSITEGAFSGAGTLSALDCTQPVALAPGASLECTATYTVVQADVDAGSITNAATATGTPPTEPPLTPTDETTVTTDPAAPNMTLVKVADKTSGLKVGDEVTYTLTATNTGNVTLTDASIIEGAFSGGGTLSALDCTQPATLAPGQTLECTATYTVVQADVNAGSITNAASATGTPPTGEPVTPTAEETVTTVPAAPNMSLTKVADKTSDLKVGDVVTYTFTAENTGNVTLTDVSISEGAFTGAGTLSALACTQPVTLDPGQTLECTATYTVVQRDVDAGSIRNAATATGTPPTGEPVTPVDETTVTTVDAAPSIALEKVADKTDVDAGDTVTYTMTATNTGNVTLTDVTITDADFGGVGTLSALSCDPSSTLDPGQTRECTATYVVEQGDVDAGSIANTAHVVGTPPTGETVTSQDDATVQTVASAPAITLEKTADPTVGAKVGDTVTYTFAVTNTGNVTLSNVELSEDDFTGAGVLGAITCDTEQPLTLARGETATCTATYVLEQGDIDAGEVYNAASVSAEAPDGTSVSATDDASVTPVQAVPAIALVKSADVDADHKVGDTVTYTITATNVGNATLTGVTISEAGFTGAGELSDLACSQGVTLAPGESHACTVTYVVQQGDVDTGSFTNTAMVVATPPTGSKLTEFADERVTTEPGVPGLDLVKTADATGPVKKGDTITYTFTATNTGNVTLADVIISEGSFSGAGELSALVCDQPAKLAPGQTLVCTATYTVVQADVDAGEISNSATVTATPPTGPITKDTDKVDVPTDKPAPTLSLEKTSDATSGIKDGETVTYTLTATNTGNVTLAEVSIAEGAFSGSGELGDLRCAQPTTLVPGGQLICTVSYTATKADATAGSITNTASATGKPVIGGGTVSAEDTLTVTTVPVPALPATGAAAVGIPLAWAGGILAMGAMLLVVARRRRTRS